MAKPFLKGCKNYTVRYFVLLCTVLFTACQDSSSGSEAQNTLVGVVATTGMVADVAKNVAGDCAEVTTLMGPGIDPHLYKASARDTRTLAQTDLVFYSGYHLEGSWGRSSTG